MTEQAWAMPLAEGLRPIWRVHGRLLLLTHRPRMRALRGMNLVAVLLPCTPESVLKQQRQPVFAWVVHFQKIERGSGLARNAGGMADAR